MFLMAVHYPALERGAVRCWLLYFHDSREMTTGYLKVTQSRARLDRLNLNSLLLAAVADANPRCGRHPSASREAENQDYMMLDHRP